MNTHHLVAISENRQSESRKANGSKKSFDEIRTD